MIVFLLLGAGSEEEAAALGAGESFPLHQAKGAGLLVQLADTPVTASLPLQDDGLLGGGAGVLAVGLCLEPGGTGRRGGDVPARCPEHAAVVHTVALGPRSIPQLVGLEGEDDADGRRERLGQQDLRGASLVELGVRGVHLPLAEALV